MNHRERVMGAVRHQPVDRIPTDMWATPEVQETLFDHFGIATARGTKPLGWGLNGGALSRGIEALLELWDRMDVDGIPLLKPPYIGPSLVAEESYRTDEWGMGYRPQRYELGVYWEQAYYPLAEAETIADLERYRWPDPDWFDYSALPRLAAQCPDRAMMTGLAMPFYFHNGLRGLELSLMDPILRPEFTHYLLARIMDFFVEYSRRCLAATRGLADMLPILDDYGSQRGLLISRHMFEQFYRGPLQRAVDVARNLNVIAFHHNDGDCRQLLPALVEIGIDVLNPVQWRCGDWDLAALKAEYGSRLCFHSCLDNQHTVPFGTPQEIRMEVRRVIETLGSDRTGLILAPAHNIQAVTPIENILAVYDSAREFGTFA